jgi:hypothetical protein
MVLSVPRRVLTSAGAVIPAGVSVAILGFFDACAKALDAKDASPREARPRKRLVIIKDFFMAVLLS